MLNLRLLIFAFVVTLAGCQSGSMTKTSETITIADGDSQYTISRESTSDSKQDSTKPPEATLEPLTVIPTTIDTPDGPKTAFEIRGGGSNAVGAWITVSQAAQKLLQIPLLASLGIFGLGVAALIWLPVKKIGLIIMAAGAGMAILSYLLASYAAYIGIGVGVVAIAGGAFYIYDYRKRAIAAKELVQTVQENKTPDTKFHHSKATKKVVRDVKKQLYNED